jgi:hypothetical protein
MVGIALALTVLLSGKYAASHTVRGSPVRLVRSLPCYHQLSTMMTPAPAVMKETAVVPGGTWSSTRSPGRMTQGAPPLAVEAAGIAAVPEKFA